MGAEPIEDHAVIGDCRSAALVARSGTIDWLCWPRFDDPPVFGALLDPRAGEWSIRPVGTFRATREYLPGTNVLRTRFETSGGTLTLTDFMPLAIGSGLVPARELLRIAECTAGSVELEMRFAPRPDFGRERPSPRPAGRLGFRLQTRRGLLTLRSDAFLMPAGAEATARARLHAGDLRRFALSMAVDWPEACPPLAAHAARALDETAAWWRSYSAGLRYRGPFRAAVERSALALRLLLYSPSGAIVAAPTTSLPEKPGGDANWDYRFCWLRDASMTVRALLGLGRREDAEAFVSWLLHSTRLTRPAFRVLYDVYGNRPPREREVPGLEGYGGARPVRLGNAAMEQVQLDVYGEVVEAAARVLSGRARIDQETARLLCDAGDYVCEHWRLPDEGIWESRGPRRHRTHSRVLCWTALDQLLRLSAEGLLPRAPSARYAAVRDEIRSEVEENGWDPALRSYVPAYGERGADTALLLLAWHGYQPASSERMKRTYARIRGRLGSRNGLLYRSDDPDLAGEGAFGIASFWEADFLALGGGTLEEATRAFARVAAQANDVGLFAEEIDPASSAALGNFPQAFTHVGLINAALSIERRARAGACQERA